MLRGIPEQIVDIPVTWGRARKNVIGDAIMNADGTVVITIERPELVHHFLDLLKVNLADSICLDLNLIPATRKEEASGEDPVQQQG